MSELDRILAAARRQPIRDQWYDGRAPVMQATLTRTPFSGSGWVFERKLDGIRCLVHVENGRITLYSRNHQRLNDTYPELVDSWTAQNLPDLIVDGEIVAFDGRVTSFSRLQKRSKISDPGEARESRIAVYYYAFDLLHLDGCNTTQLALRTRKRLLNRAVGFHGRIRFTPHRNRAGVRYHRQACRKGWEGLIAKRADGAYVHGRSRSWLKLKCINQQELVVGGFTDPQGSRTGFGSLLLGYYRGSELVYAGLVGTGFDEAELRDLHARLHDIERDTSAFANARRPPAKGVHWARPVLVAEIAFTEWTRDGKLRHPRFLGLRNDKEPREVVRE